MEGTVSPVLETTERNARVGKWVARHKATAQLGDHFPKSRRMHAGSGEYAEDAPVNDRQHKAWMVILLAGRIPACPEQNGFAQALDIGRCRRGECPARLLTHVELFGCFIEVGACVSGVEAQDDDVIVP